MNCSRSWNPRSILNSLRIPFRFFLSFFPLIIFFRWNPNALIRILFPLFVFPNFFIKASHWFCTCLVNSECFGVCLFLCVRLLSAVKFLLWDDSVLYASLLVNIQHWLLDPECSMSLMWYGCVDFQFHPLFWKSQNLIFILKYRVISILVLEVFIIPFWSLNLPICSTFSLYHDSIWFLLLFSSWLRQWDKGVFIFLIILFSFFKTHMRKKLYRSVVQLRDNGKNQRKSQ